MFCVGRQVFLIFAVFVRFLATLPKLTAHKKQAERALPAFFSQALRACRL